MQEITNGRTSGPRSNCRLCFQAGLAIRNGSGAQVNEATAREGGTESSPVGHSNFSSELFGSPRLSSRAVLACREPLASCLAGHPLFLEFLVEAEEACRKNRPRRRWMGISPALLGGTESRPCDRPEAISFSLTDRTLRATYYSFRFPEIAHT